MYLCTYVSIYLSIYLSICVYIYIYIYIYINKNRDKTQMNTNEKAQDRRLVLDANSRPDALPTFAVVVDQTSAKTLPGAAPANGGSSQLFPSVFGWQISDLREEKSPGCPVCGGTRRPDPVPHRGARKRPRTQLASSARLFGTF